MSIYNLSNLATDIDNLKKKILQVYKLNILNRVSIKKNKYNLFLKQIEIEVFRIHYFIIVLVYFSYMEHCIKLIPENEIYNQ